ncbi:MAG: type IV toxin-antitoxin system AbiEi family antitoxin, partial [Thermoanaerobaculia bacterium]
TLTYWVEKTPARLIARQALRPADKGRVEFRRIFWNQEALRNGAEKCVPPVLIYADLIGIADARAVETATKLKTERIDEDWRQYDPRAVR